MMRFCGFFILLVALAAAAAAQPTTATSPSTRLAAAMTRPSVPPPPIPPSEIASKSETTLLTLQNMLNLPPDPAVQAIEQDLPDLISDIDSRAAETEKGLTVHSSLQTVRSLQFQWEATDKTLTNWRADLSASSKELDHRFDQLEKMQTDWQQTLRWADQVKASSELVAPTNATLAAIARAQTQLFELRSPIWALTRRVDAQDARVEQNLASVQLARQQIFSRMLLRDSPPLWSAFNGGEAGTVHGGENDFVRSWPISVDIFSATPNALGSTPSY